MSKKAQTDFPVHDLMASRWSPWSFSDRPVTKDVLGSLMEAARWAPSCYNEQPWRFVVATKEDEAEYDRLASCLVDGNAWARAAPVLLLACATTTFARNGKDNRHAQHDLGLAVGSLVLQAESMGLVSHQMGGFLADQARQEYRIPDDIDILSVIALGYPGDDDALPSDLRERLAAPRSRKPLADLFFSGEWAKAHRDL